MEYENEASLIYILRNKKLWQRKMILRQLWVQLMWYQVGAIAANAKHFLFLLFTENRQFDELLNHFHIDCNEFWSFIVLLAKSSEHFKNDSYFNQCWHKLLILANLYLTALFTLASILIRSGGSCFRFIRDIHSI